MSERLTISLRDNVSTAAQCRKMGIKVGDTIEGREGDDDYWNEARLTLLWLGNEVAVWKVWTRHYRRQQWQSQGEQACWTLDCREWRKVAT